ncbi:hypothetical protein BaRGS_00021365, partial [Batillaria attramentaria]
HESPEKTVTLYPNSLPWISKDVKEAVGNRRQAFQSHDKQSVKQADAVLTLIRHGQGKTEL